MRCIDADQALAEADRLLEHYNLAMANAENNREINHILKRQELFKAVRAVVNTCPTIEPVKHGHWIEGCPTETTDYFNCSVCNAGIFVNNLWRVSHEDVSEIHRFCLNCGAKMDSKEE